MTLRIRGHTLLCIQGYVGEGYSAAFVENLTRVVASLEPGTLVTVTAEPDVVCVACPNLSEAGCALHGEGTERGIVAQDRDVLARLGLREGQAVAWAELLERIRERVAPADLDSICGRCPWLPAGHCRRGLERLVSARPR